MSLTESSPGARGPSAKAIRVVLILSTVAIVGLAGVVAPPLMDRLALGRDATRVSDLELLRAAIEAYRTDHGMFPPGNPDQGRAGWDTSLDGEFLQALVDGGYLDRTIVDPSNDEDHHYRYYRYESGYEGFDRDFYVLGARTLETDRTRERSPGFRGDLRDWSQEFDYVTGGY